MRTAALAAALVVSGCGAGVASERPPSLAKVAAATAAQPYRFTAETRLVGAEEEYETHALGAVDPAAGRWSASYSLQLDGEAMTIETRRVNGKSYSRVAAEGLPDGWGEDPSAGDELLPVGALAEPHRVVGALRAHGRVEQFAGGEIDGVPTFGYRGTIPAIELLAAGRSGRELEELRRELAETRSGTADIEVRADADGIVRELSFAIPVHEDGRRSRFETSTRFSGFGEPLTIVAPLVDPAGRSEVWVDILREESEADGPCAGAAAPHRPAAVLAALRRGGLQAEATCMSDETIIFAHGSSEQPIFCVVARDAAAARDVLGDGAAAIPLVDGNVACDVAAPERALVRAALARL